MASITNLAAGATVYGTVGVEVTADDDHGIERVELYGDSTLVQTLTSAPYSFSLDTTQFSNGALTVRAVAYDGLGLTGSASVNVILANIFPPVNLKASRMINRSLLLREYVNVLTWADNSRNSGVTKYRIYRITEGGRSLVAEVTKAAGNTVYRYLHRRIDRAQAYTYEVVAVGASDREGIAARVTAR